LGTFPFASMRRIPIIAIATILSTLLLSSRTTYGQVRLTDASDRAALRAWFVLLADAQFYRATADVTDCAALVRHALREALRPHTPEWRRTMALPGAPVYADVRVKTPLNEGGGLAMFRVDAAAYQEFADAKTIVRLNARPIGRDINALRPGDLIYFHQPSQNAPDHLMVFVGSSSFEPEGRDWVVYHTGPETPHPNPLPASGARGQGEVRKVRLRDLMRHPSARWRPVAANPQFVGVFRLDLL
jgi:uncharacterized protein YfaT (DUF1175 family)